MTDSFRERLAAALAPTYRIDDELVGGGMSRVFAATENALGRRVVIKVLPPELSAGVNRERFQREIQVAAQLQHPHIVPLLSAGRIPSPDAAPAEPDATMPGRSSAAAADGELLYYTMPFIEGESLRTALAHRGPLSVREVVRILHDVVEALAYAHGRGVVHRDIKPGNILTIGAHALVTDFGVAKALTASLPVSGMTSAGMAIGTPAYMAPEQLAADPAADHRIDIYAVGLLAYELLSGVSPFVGTSPQATMAAQLTRVPDPLDTVRDDVPPALAAVITRCLEKLPDNRPQTADALLDLLDGASTPGGGTVAARGLSATGSPGRHRWSVLVGAALVLVVGAAVALGMWRRAVARGGLATTAASSPITPPAPMPPSAVLGTAGVGAARPGGDSLARTPIVITRAESLAIAEAIRKRVTARRDSQIERGEQAVAESLSVRFERALSDSLARIIGALRGARRTEVRPFDPADIERFRELARMSAAIPQVPGVGSSTTRTGTATVPGPSPRPEPGVTRYRELRPPAPPLPMPAPGVHRVLVGAPRASAYRRELGAIGALVADSVRRAISARPGYDAVDASRLTDPRFYSSRTRTALARAVGAGAVLTGVYFTRADSVVVLQLQLFDVRRNRVVRVLESGPVDVTNPMRGIDDLIASTVAALDGVDWRSASDSAGAPRGHDAGGPAVN